MRFFKDLFCPFLFFLQSSVLLLGFSNSKSQAFHFITISGRRYLPLGDIVESLKLRVVKDDQKGSVTLAKGDAHLKVAPNVSYITYNDCKIFCSRRLSWNEKSTLISYDDYRKILVPLLFPKSLSNVPRLKKIVIDPGHGGKDPGAINVKYNLQEKDLTLKVSKILEKELKGLGYIVELTRNNDQFLELKERSRKAKTADLFLSIHFNSAKNFKAHGVEILTLTRADMDSTAKGQEKYNGNKLDVWNLVAGYSLLPAMANGLKLENRGLKFSELGVLKGLNCPGVLIECGFLSNDGEASEMVKQSQHLKIAKAIIEGVKKYDANLRKIR